jgi:hypothetical protein
MLVHFKLQSSITKEILVTAATQEFIGYDKGYYSFARLLVWDGAELREYSGMDKEGKTIHFHPDDDGNDKYVTNGTVFYRNDLTTYPGQMTWVTAMSGFRYDFFEEDHCIYIGADKGFISQNLIPPCLKEDVEILSVGGTYGDFTGPKSLDEYRAR